MSGRARADQHGWFTPAALPAVDSSRATVWLARISEHAATAPAFFSMLDASERDAARRFHFVADRQRYVVAHGTLRLLLAAHSGRAPTALRFTPGAFGKPTLCAAPGVEPLEFNLSHSGDLVAVAVSRSGPVGVDVEARVDLPDAETLARQFFSAAERQALASVEPGRRTAAFFACWTRKEAYIKATGLGLSAGLEYFDVSLAPDVPAAILADRRNEGMIEWALHDLEVPNGYAGALVCDRTLQPPTRFVLSPQLARSLSERAA